MRRYNRSRTNRGDCQGGARSQSRSGTESSPGRNATATRTREKGMASIQSPRLAQRRNLHEQNSTVIVWNCKPGHHVGTGRFSHVCRCDPRGQTPTASTSLAHIGTLSRIFSVFRITSAQDGKGLIFSSGTGTGAILGCDGMELSKKREIRSLPFESFKVRDRLVSRWPRISVR